MGKMGDETHEKIGDECIWWEGQIYFIYFPSWDGIPTRVASDLRKSDPKVRKSEVLKSENPIIRHPRF